MAVMESFSALDFETATNHPASICQVGVVRVEDGLVTERFNELVRPPNNRYFHRNIEVHGIQPSDTEAAEDFEHVWFKFRHLIEDQIVVAHNANFDVNCLRNALAYFDLLQPQFEIRCTRMIYKRGLAYLCKKYRIPLDHHDALSDAEACAQLYQKHLIRQNLPKSGSLFD